MDSMKPAMFCVALRPGRKRFQELFEGEGVKAFACVNDVSLGLKWESRPTRLEILPSLRPEQDGIGRVSSLAKTAASPRKGLAPDGGGYFIP